MNFCEVKKISIKNLLVPYYYVLFLRRRRVKNNNAISVNVVLF